MTSAEASSRRSASFDGAGSAAMKAFKSSTVCVWVPYQALTVWHRYKREIERCLVQYGPKSAQEAAALVEERIRPPSGDDDFTLFHELPWGGACCSHRCTR